MYCGEECNACTVGPLRRSCLTACGALSASRSDSIGLVSLFDTERPRPTKSASRSCPSFHDHTVNLFTSCLIRYLFGPSVAAAVDEACSFSGKGTRRREHVHFSEDPGRCLQWLRTFKRSFKANANAWPVSKEMRASA